MVAEILSGDSFSITPDNKIYQLVRNDRTTIWVWYITALQAGEHKLVLDVSVPVLVDQTESKYEMAHVGFNISVPESVIVEPTMTPTPVPPTPTSTPVPPTSTSIPSISSQLSASAGEITVAVIGAASAIIVAFIGGYYVYKEKQKIEQAAENKRREEFSENLQKKNKSDFEENKRKAKEKKEAKKIK